MFQAMWQKFKAVRILFHWQGFRVLELEFKEFRVSAKKILCIFLCGLALAALYAVFSRFTNMLPCYVQWIWGTVAAFLLGSGGMFLFLLAKELYNRILLTMVLGALFGCLFGPNICTWVAPLGEMFIRLLKMVVVPLVFASLTLGVLSLGDIKKVGRIGSKALLYFIVTTMLAIGIGLVLTDFMRPGNYVSQESKQKFEAEYQQKVKDKAATPVSLRRIIVEIVPANPVDAMTRGDMLQVIVFALLLGVMLTKIAKERQEVIYKALDGLNEAMVHMVMAVMQVAPLGVFALMADTVAKAGAEIFKALAVYALTVLCGFVLHIVVVWGIALRLLAGMGLCEFLQKTREVILVAFTTSSSNATLPVSLRCCEETLKIRKEISSFVIPLGATINMNGTALYLAVASTFIAQVFNVPLSLSDKLTILILTTFAAIGTPGIPSASIVFLAMILDTLQIPAIGIAIVLGLDRILDMCRTVLNVLGDLTAAMYLHASENKRRIL
jgi:Na+/H+-dicarboxylate symporter